MGLLHVLRRWGGAAADGCAVRAAGSPGEGRGGLDRGRGARRDLTKAKARTSPAPRRIDERSAVEASAIDREELERRGPVLHPTPRVSPPVWRLPMPSCSPPKLDCAH